MSSYLKPKRTNVIFNADDYNYGDEDITYHDAEDRYLHTSGDLAVSFAENTIFKNINEMPVNYLSSVESDIQQQIDNIGVNSGGDMFQLVLESTNVNVNNNGGYAFSNTKNK